MLTAGFVPNVVSAFVAVGDAQDPLNNTFDNKTINGVYRSEWFGMYIATPAWKQFMNTYLNAINAPIDNNYGNPAQKYLTRATRPRRTDNRRRTRTRRASSPALRPW